MVAEGETEWLAAHAEGLAADRAERETGFERCILFDNVYLRHDRANCNSIEVFRNVDGDKLLMGKLAYLTKPGEAVVSSVQVQCARCYAGHRKCSKWINLDKVPCQDALVAYLFRARSFKGTDEHKASFPGIMAEFS